jgi:parallel beta-helix repeat protein
MRKPRGCCIYHVNSNSSLIFNSSVRVFSLLLFLFIFALPQVFAVDISSCQTLNSPNTVYTLTTNVSSGYTCFTIAADNVTLDCQGYTIKYASSSTGYGIYINNYNYITIRNCNIQQANDGISNAHGVYIESSSYNNITNVSINATGYGSYGAYLSSSSNNTFTNNTITANEISAYLSSSSNNTFTNNTITAYYDGASLYSSSNNIFTNNTITSTYRFGVSLSSSSNYNTFTNNTITANYYGAYLSSSSNNTFTNNNISSGNSYGVYLDSSSDNTFANNNISAVLSYALALTSSTNNLFTYNTITTPVNFGAYLFFSSNNTFTNNFITSMTEAGVYLYESSDNTFYNNLINGTPSVSFESTIYQNFWSTTLTSGPNIVGGPYIGGNFYATPDGNGFSETCTDRGDGICNTIYDILGDGSNVDYFPLAAPPNASGCDVLDQPNTVYTLTQNVSSSGTCFTIQADNVTLDCNGYTINYASSSTGYGIYIPGSSYATIKNCKIQQANEGVSDAHGIYLSSSSYNNITNVSINAIGSWSYGVYLSSSSNNIFTNNTITANEISAYLSSSSNNTFTNNTITSTYSNGVSLSSSSNNTFTNNTITAYYDGASLYSSSNNIFTNNTITAYYDGASLYSSSNNIFTNNTITSTYHHGARLDFSSNNTFTNNNITANRHGAYLYYSSYNTLEGNKINKGAQGLYITGSSLEHFQHNISSTNTINGKPIYYRSDIYGGCPTSVDTSTYSWVGIVNCANVNIIGTFSNSLDHLLLANTSRSNITGLNVTSYYGFYIFYSSNYNTFTNNTITAGGNGAYLYSSSNNTFTNNTFTSTYGHGAYLEYYSNYNTFTNNTISSTYGSGARLDFSSNYNTFTNNTITGSVYLDSSSNNIFTNNTITAYVVGAYLYYSSNYNTFTNNIITAYYDGAFLSSSSNYNTFISNKIQSSNSYAMYLSSSSNNLIYNNLLNGSVGPVSVDSNSNFWNTTLTSGTNIIGGPYIGGNFYANSTGGFSQTCTDSDEDGICDSNYTINGQNIDYLPLAVPLAIPDLTPPLIQILSPSSGLWFNYSTVNISFKVTDDYSSVINCSFYDNGSYKGSMSINNNTVTTVSPSLEDARHIVYMNCSDEAGNSNVSQNITIYVDTTEPTITSFTLSASTVNVGDTITASCIATDNSQSYEGSVTTQVTGIDTSSAGTKVAVCTATDTAGNKKTATVSYTVNAPVYQPPPAGGGGGCTPIWSCSEWSSCSREGIMTRTCIDINNCGTTSGKPAEISPCTYICIPNWQCTAWSECSPNGIQTRTCKDINNCGFTPPQTTKSCFYIPKELQSEEDQSTVNSIQSSISTLLNAVNENDTNTIDLALADSFRNINFLLSTSPTQQNLQLANYTFNTLLSVSSQLAENSQFSSSANILSNVSTSIPLLSSIDSSYSNKLVKNIISKSFILSDQINEQIRVLSQLVSSLRESFNNQLNMIRELQTYRLDPNSLLRLNELGTSTKSMSDSVSLLDDTSSLLQQASLETDKGKKQSLVQQSLSNINQSLLLFPEVRKAFSYSMIQDSDQLTLELIKQNAPDYQEYLDSLKENIPLGALPISKSVFSYSISNEEFTDKTSDITIVKLTVSSANELENATIIEYIPKSQNISISDISSSENFTILNEDPVIQFNLGTIALGQTKTITYTISKKLSTYSSIQFAVGKIKIAGIPTIPEYQLYEFPEGTEFIRAIAAILIILFLIIEYVLTPSKPREFSLFKEKKKK